MFPHHIAEGRGEGSELPDGGAAREREAAPEADPAAASPGDTSVARIRSAPPDPEPLRMREQVEYTWVWENDDVRLESVRLLQLAEPVVTPRRMGRFAMELWIGNELVDRVRFDFPLLAAEEPKDKKRRAPREPVPLTGGPVRAVVNVPLAARARSAYLIDRALERELPLRWPPVPEEPASAAGAAPKAASSALTSPSAAEPSAAPAPAHPR